jgi:hypothetical protein
MCVSHERRHCRLALFYLRLTRRIGGVVYTKAPENERESVHTRGGGWKWGESGWEYKRRKRGKEIGERRAPSAVKEAADPTGTPATKVIRVYFQSVPHFPDIRIGKKCRRRPPIHTPAGFFFVAPVDSNNLFRLFWVFWFISPPRQPISVYSYVNFHFGYWKNTHK